MVVRARALTLRRNPDCSSVVRTGARRDENRHPAVEGGARNGVPPEDIDRALSPEALTSAVMQRYHVYVACRRELGAKFGKLATSP